MNIENAYAKQIAGFNRAKDAGAKKVRLDHQETGIYMACFNKVDAKLMGKSDVINLKIDVGQTARDSGKPINQVKETFQKFFDLGIANDFKAEFEGDKLMATIAFTDYNSQKYNSLAQNAVAFALANQKQRAAHNSANAKALNNHYKNK